MVVMESAKMPVTVFEHIKGGKIPAALSKLLKENPEETFRITVVPESEMSKAGEEMPPEETFSGELIASVKRSEKNLKAGKFTTLSTKEERDAHFKKIWNE